MRLPSNAEINQAAQTLLAEEVFADESILKQRLDSSKAVVQLAKRSIDPIINISEDLPPKEVVLAILEAAIVTFFRLGMLTGAAIPKEAQE